MTAAFGACKNSTTSQVERLDEHAPVVDLPAGAGAEEAPKLRLGGASRLRGLPLERPERAQLAQLLDDAFDRVGPEGADQLVLQVLDADEEAERLHPGAGEAVAESRPLEGAPEAALLPLVAEAGQPEVAPTGPEPVEEAADVPGSPDRDDGDALGLEVAAAPLGQRLDRGPVAGPLDEHGGTGGRGRERHR
jgi:hypothetical protein